MISNKPVNIYFFPRQAVKCAAEVQEELKGFNLEGLGYQKGSTVKVVEEVWNYWGTGGEGSELGRLQSHEAL